MVEPSGAHLLSPCASPKYKPLVRAIHCRFLKLGSFSTLHLVTRLLVAEARCGMVDEACLLFDEMSHLVHYQLDAVCWNSIISGCIQNRREEAALRYFRKMQSHHPPDSYTLSSILSSDHCLEKSKSSGEQLHGYAIKSGVTLLSPSVANALITFYAGWDRLGESMLVFQSMPALNVVSWTAIISAFTQRRGLGEESLRLFLFMMREDGQRPNQFTFASMLGSCGSLASLSQGLQFVAMAQKMGFLDHIHVQNSLLGFYSECGCLEDAKTVFKSIVEPDIVSWNSLLKGYSRRGRGEEALRGFQEMLVTGAKPDVITFISVLSACSHSGMASEGLELFQSMEQDYGIKPQIEHVSCMVNLLGRAGKLSEAKEFVGKIQFEPGPSVWRTLLGACRVHGNADELAELAAKRLVKLEPYDTEARIVLSHIYAARGRWDMVADLRRLMKEKGVAKEPGYSWITVGYRVHCFVAMEGGHPQIHEIETRLKELTNNIKDEIVKPTS